MALSNPLNFESTDPEELKRLSLIYIFEIEIYSNFFISDMDAPETRQKQS